ncbi:MAG TPA: hypothetical protein VLW84_14770, partial [Terriglobales bacterium]|nr:hypothetical protein [Terriglobales bacterium]
MHLGKIDRAASRPPSNSGVSFPAPASLLSKASIAEASRTILLTSGSLAALGDELCGQRAAG